VRQFQDAEAGKRNVSRLWALVLICAAGAGNAQLSDRERQEWRQVLELRTNPLYERASLWRCDATIRFVCAEDGCTRRSAIDAIRWIEIDFARNLYSQCSAKDCKRRTALRRREGTYTVVEPAGESDFLKVLNDGTAFVETMTLGTSVHLAFGACQRSGEETNH
jgi:hypothetical protein